jgi:hypothetical protein
VQAIVLVSIGGNVFESVRQWLGNVLDPPGVRQRSANRSANRQPPRGATDAVLWGLALAGILMLLLFAAMRAFPV